MAAAHRDNDTTYFLTPQMNSSICTVASFYMAYTFLKGIPITVNCVRSSTITDHFNALQMRGQKDMAIEPDQLAKFPGTNVPIDAVNLLIKITAECVREYPTTNRESFEMRTYELMKLLNILKNYPNHILVISLLGASTAIVYSNRNYYYFDSHGVVSGAKGQLAYIVKTPDIRKILDILILTAEAKTKGMGGWDSVRGEDVGIMGVQHRILQFDFIILEVKNLPTGAIDYENIVLKSLDRVPMIPDELIKSAPVEQAKPAQTQIQCPECTFINESTANTCAVCEQPFPKGTVYKLETAQTKQEPAKTAQTKQESAKPAKPAKPAPAPSKPAPNQKTCSTCGFYNEKIVKYCEMCHQKFQSGGNPQYPKQQYKKLKSQYYKY
jgi:hypothetical protein